MRRRDLLAAGAAGLATSLAGCVARATGWSSLGLTVRNALDRPVGLRVTIDVNGRRAVDRRFDLGANARIERDLAIEVPWNGALSVRAARTGADAAATGRWRASIPLWGGNKCAIEPAVRIDADGIELGPACV